MGDDRFSRRGFIQGAAVSLAMVSGCASPLPAGRLIPDVTPPLNGWPGEPVHYRTVCRACSAGCGVEARILDGRLVKLEGSPDHPVNRGALCARGQAELETMYHPSRLGSPLAGATPGALAPVSWEEAEQRLVDGLKAAMDAGKTIAVIGAASGGMMGALVPTWLAALGQDPSAHHWIEPEWVAARRAGCAAIWGEDALPVHDVGAARALLAVADDFLDEGPSPVEDARGVADLRAAGGRFVYAGPRLSRTAVAADEAVLLAPGAELDFVLGLARAVLEDRADRLEPELAAQLHTELARFTPAAVSARTGLSQQRLTGFARWLLRAGPVLVTGPGRVAGGDPEALAAAVQLLNLLCGAAGSTLWLSGAPARAPSWSAQVLARHVDAGEVGALVVLGDRLPAGPKWSAVPFVAVIGQSEAGAAERAHLVLAAHHPLEDWDRVTVRPGIVGFQQPVMTPLRDTRAPMDLLLAAARSLKATDGLPTKSAGSWVRHGYPKSARADGGVFGEASLKTPTPSISGAPWSAASETAAAGPVLVSFPTLVTSGEGLSRASLLHEIPDPISSVSWSGWIELDPDLAEREGITEGDLVSVESERGQVILPAWVWSGLAKGAVAIPVGFASALGVVSGSALRLSPTGQRAPAPRAAGSETQQGRDLAPVVKTTTEVIPRSDEPSMYPPLPKDKRRWAMAVDLDRCTGCTACIAACYAENNIPVVGREDVAVGRTMSWLRIDRFIEGPEDVRFLPVMCQHCTNAPCETVCPVYATYHQHEGLNVQVYNRCVGTRYCENNCVYSVRRFNWFDHPRDEIADLGLNPEVSVRERGVVEKCSFCSQRIRRAEELAALEGRELAPNEVVPACAQTCPSDAVVFGNLYDPRSAVASAAESPRAYRLMEELNTEPGVHYLARVRGEKIG